MNLGIHVAPFYCSPGLPRMRQPRRSGLLVGPPGGCSLTRRAAMASTIRAQVLHTPARTRDEAFRPTSRNADAVCCHVELTNSTAPFRFCQRNGNESPEKIFLLNFHEGGCAKRMFRISRARLFLSFCYSLGEARFSGEGMVRCNDSRFMSGTNKDLCIWNK
ncbi:hypothetical protein [Burkholderia gladioli]|uniref:hypothetical protein n=1 Tax=Burkholderia gladioli TaxID=28095 RepID=UPI00163E85F5|nr:hypothetical protein [Burkholderia gladioli]